MTSAAGLMPERSWVPNILGAILSAGRHSRPRTDTAVGDIGRGLKATDPSQSSDEHRIPLLRRLLRIRSVEQLLSKLDALVL
jgi:hypothetical protein